MPDQVFLDTLDKMLSGELNLDEHSYRLVVLAELKAIRQKQITLLEKIDGNGQLGLIRRVELLEERIPLDMQEIIFDLRKTSALINNLGRPLALAIIVGVIGFIWALLTHQIHIGP